MSASINILDISGVRVSSSQGKEKRNLGVIEVRRRSGKQMSRERFMYEALQKSIAYQEERFAQKESEQDAGFENTCVVYETWLSSSFQEIIRHRCVSWL